MFGRKAKPEPEQGSGRRQVQRQGNSPAFSYYTSRPSEVTPRPAARREEPAETKKGGRMTRSFAQLPFWLLVVLVAICLVKVLFLSTDPKVVVLGNTPVSATYLRPTSTYAQAVHKQLSGSLTNHSKLTVNLSGTVATLRREFPELQAVSMTIPLISSRPIVYLQVAQPSLILQTARGNYALNKSGLVLAQLHTLPSGVPLVVDQSNDTPKPGAQYLASTTVSFIQTLAYQFAAAKLNISTFVLPANSPYELDIRLEGQPYAIKCNLQGDALEQSGAAVATVQQLAGSPPSEYIDVRTPERVYYK